MSLQKGSSTSSGLTHAQRNRLIKSTRKLGMVLGETPTVDGVSGASSSPLLRSTATSTDSESHSRPSLSLARQSSASSSSTSSSRPSLSLAPSPPIDINILPPPLASPTTGTSTPLTPTFVILNRDSPFCADDSEFESHRVTDIRRKKMAKLVRTFGENVPPELVTIGHLGDSTGGIGSRSSQESNSRKYGGVNLKRLSTSTTTSSLSFSDSSSQCSLPSPQTQTLKTLPLPPLSPRSASLGRSKSLYSLHPRSRNHSHHRATSANADRELAFARLTGDGATPGSASKVQDPEMNQHLHVILTETHRKGREWSGEWNQRDMQHVVNQLRRLK